jgi:hypoxanthine phosphoribosyltransferase
MRCIVTNWDYMDGLCRKVAEQIMEDDFEPDVIVALAKGGWFAGRILCDILGLNELTSLKIEHYEGISEKGAVTIRYSIPNEAVFEKKVLVVDDIANTGMSVRKAKEHIESLDAEEVRTATLLLLHTSKFIPDYFGEYIEEWAWVIFPWNFIEDMVSLITRLMKDEKKDLWSEWDIKWGLYRRFNLDPIYLEISQPGRFNEVLSIMERRGIVVRIVEDDRVYWSLAEEV